MPNIYDMQSVMDSMGQLNEKLSRTHPQIIVNHQIMIITPAREALWHVAFSVVVSVTSPCDTLVSMSLSSPGQ